MPIIQDIDRPDVKGKAPKMQTIADIARQILSDAYMNITANDNIMSTVEIRGSHHAKQAWPHGIFMNGKYYIFHISPMQSKRYYHETDPKVTVEMVNAQHGMKRFRKYTGPVGKVVAKVQAWIEDAT